MGCSSIIVKNESFVGRYTAEKKLVLTNASEMEGYTKY